MNSTVELPRWLEGRAHLAPWYDEQEKGRVREHGMVPRWELLTALIRAHGFARICEMGVGQGLNAGHILEECGRFIDLMVLVDKSRHEEFARRIEAEGWPAHYLEMLSVHAAALYPPRHFDLVFIDACHDYRDVREDIDAWLPKVRPGGILAGHDWSLPQTGVREAVLETLALNSINIAEDPASGGKKWCWWALVSL